MTDSAIRAGVRRLFRLALRRDALTRRDVDDEIDIHLALRVEHLMRHGWTEPEARMEAERRFGALTQARETLRQDALRRQRRLSWREWLDTALQDLGYAFRQLRRHPAFTASAITMLALGIGANTTIFSLVNATLLRPPAHIVAPDRLAAIFTSDFSGPPYGSSSLPDVEDFAAARDVFASVSAYTFRPTAVGTDDNVERVTMELVSINYFRALGVVAQSGRFFSDDEGRPNGAAVAVISDALWRRRFGANPSIVGGTIQLNGTTFTVTGIAPAGFLGAQRGIASDVWVPTALGPLAGADPSDLTSRGSRGYLVLARLAPRITLEQAQARMTVLAGALHTAHPTEWTDVSEKGRRITLVAERDARVPPPARGPVLGFLGILSATVGLVLLVCCANVAGLLLARAAARGREMAVRLSLGAGRPRLVRQLLTESLVLSVLGGAGGVLLAYWATRAIARLRLPLPVTVALDLSLDVRVLAFTALVTLGTGIVFGLAPAMQGSRLNLVGALKAEGEAVRIGGRRVSLQSVLAGAQVAVSLLLVAGALLFVQSLAVAARIDPGFDARDLAIAELRPRIEPGQQAPDTRAAIALEMQRRIAPLAGVRGVTWASFVPLSFNGGRRSVVVRDYQARSGEDMEFNHSAVGPAYFETMRVPLLLGRDFTPQDRSGSAPVLIVNESFAKRFWGASNPLGREVSLSGPGGPWAQVVGVARDGKYLSLGESGLPFYWYPALQSGGDVSLIVRTAAAPTAILPAIRRELSAAAPGWEVRSSLTMDEQLGSSLLPQRIAGLVLSLFGIVALFLAAIGLYGVIAQAVARRTREIGVRMALGASGRDVRALVFRGGVRLVGWGVAVGIPLAWGGARLLRGFLLGGEELNLVAFGGAVIVLAVVAAGAIVVPANRAVAVDPMQALRAE